MITFTVATPSSQSHREITPKGTRGCGGFFQLSLRGPSHSTVTPHQRKAQFLGLVSPNNVIRSRAGVRLRPC